MKLLALVDSPEHVCCRYRIRAFEPCLQRRGDTLTLEPVRAGTIRRGLDLARLPRHGVTILQRKLLSSWHFHLLRRNSRRLVFDFDDAVLFRDSYDPRGPHCPRRARRFARTVRSADTVIAGNDFLADCALRAGAAPDRVRVIPTCVPTEQYRPAQKAVGEVGALDLVWIGSSSTLQGLEQSRPLWDRIGREVPGARLRVICDRFPDLGRLTVVPVPWDAGTEAEELARGDAGVTLIPEDLWSKGKCGLKLLQYEAAGLPVIANPVGVHGEMIASGVNGFLPESADDWVSAVKALAGDPSRRLQMGREARASVEVGYSVRAWEPAFVAAVAGPLLDDEPAPRSPNLRADRTRPSATDPRPRESGRARHVARTSVGGPAHQRHEGA